MDISCENCARHERGMSPTLDDWLHCEHCQAVHRNMPRRQVLQRLFRIRPQRGADGGIRFERYE
jgi:hypothetical protein